MHTLVILSALVAAASASWNGAPGWAGAPGAWGNAGWAGHAANVVVQNGQVQDTPEVAAEKAKHFALVSEASARAAASPDTGAWNNQWNNDNGQWDGNNGQWNGDNGQWNNDDGQWKNDNGQWNSGAWNGNNGAWNGNHGQWNGAPATSWASNGWAGQAAKIVVNNGHVQETPEVAAARAQHLAALQQAAGAQHGPHWG